MLKLKENSMNEIMRNVVSGESVTPNFSMQELMNITGQNAMTVGNINRQLGIVVTTVNNLSDDVNMIKSDMEILKLNEEVTTTQQEKIIETARRRTFEVLGTDIIDHKKYFRKFIGRLYSDTRKYAGLGSKIARTKKGDYQRVLDYIEAWMPVCGSAKLKSEADDNAKARLIAQSEGYIV